MIPLFKPFMPENLPDFNKILHSEALAYGYWGRNFEKLLGDYIGNENILALNSFNLAMLVTLTSFGIRNGDEVIASPMSCLASNQPFATLGIKIIWADIDPNQGTLDPDNVRKKITSKTKAIFHNHFCGYPGYIDEINLIGKYYGLFVIEDASEAFGSEYKKKVIGNSGCDATVFSFHTVRLPNTIDGGAISFKNKEFYNKASRIRDYGIDRKYFRDENGEISLDYNIEEPGFGATISEVNSYIGSMQMGMIHELITKQRMNSQNWLTKFQKENLHLKAIVSTNNNPNNWVFGVLSNTKIQHILDFRKKGYYASSVHIPNYNYSIFGNKEKLKGVEDFASKFFAIPSGWWINI